MFLPHFKNVEAERGNGSSTVTHQQVVQTQPESGSCGSQVHGLDHYATLCPGWAYGLTGSGSFLCRVGPPALLLPSPDCISKVPNSCKCACTAGVGGAGCLLCSGLVEIAGAKLLRMFLSPAHYSASWGCQTGKRRSLSMTRTPKKAFSTKKKFSA